MVSLRDRKPSSGLYSLLGIQSVADEVTHGRWRWFRQIECECSRTSTVVPNRYCSRANYLFLESMGATKSIFYIPSPPIPSSSFPSNS